MAMVIVQDTGHCMVEWNCGLVELVRLSHGSGVEGLILLCRPVSRKSTSVMRHAAQRRVRMGQESMQRLRQGKALVWDDSDGEPIEDC